MVFNFFKKNRGIKLKIENICNKYSNVKCSFIEIPKDEVLYSKKSSLDFSAFSRLFLGSLIKDEIEKVLYLDADTLVLGSLKELYDLNMEDYVVAGVQDFYYSSLKDFGLKNKNIYLNTGVLLINFSEWIKLERKFHEYIKKLDDLDSIMHDQGIINAIVEDDKKLLTKPHYNVLESYINDVGKIKKLLDFYEALYRILYSDNLDDAYRNPIIVHDKFWAKNYNNKRFREKYEEYVSLSPFEHDEIFTNINNKNRESTFKSQIFFITPKILYPLLRKLYPKGKNEVN